MKRLLAFTLTTATGALVALGGPFPAARAQTPPPAPYHQCVEIAPHTTTLMPGIPSGQRLITRHASFAYSGVRPPEARLLVLPPSGPHADALHYLPISQAISIPNSNELDWLASLAITLIIDAPQTLHVRFTHRVSLGTSGIFCISGELVPLPTAITPGGR